MSGQLEVGAHNCVVDCAGVKRGMTLYVVSQHGAVEPDVVAAIASAGRDAGAQVVEVWGHAIPKDTPSAIPEEVTAAYRNAEVLISHYPSLKREALYERLGNETRVRVPNRARTAKLLSSDWARFPYALQRSIARALDALMKSGAAWEMTSPTGTDLKGRFAEAGGKVRAAFFVDTEDGRARRNFPGGVHSPHDSTGINGIIVCDYVEGVARQPDNAPLCVEVKEGKVVGMQSGMPDGLDRAVVETSDGWIDSWHAGVNPCTEVPVAISENPREWFSYSHCSPYINHLHLGRTHDTKNLGCFAHTLKINGQLIYENGRMNYDDVPELSRLFGMKSIEAAMLQTKEFSCF